MTKRNFIPQNYPKSFVVFILAWLSGLLFGGIAFLGVWMESGLVSGFGKLGFVICWFVAAFAFLIFLPRSWAGKYQNLAPRPWKDQIW